ncbi:MAG: VOC family protein [Thioalkalivibrio sp.]|nr:VOC family protein [Thioalkalivibrio sp.]
MSLQGRASGAPRDPERSLAFYRDTLGLRLLFEAPPALAFFDVGGVRLMLDGSGGEAGEAGEKSGAEPGAESGGKSGDRSGEGVVIYYAVADLDAAFETLSGRGLSFEREPHLVARMPDHELWMAFFRDPDANLLALMSEVRP